MKLTSPINHHECQHQDSGACLACRQPRKVVYDYESKPLAALALVQKNIATAKIHILGSR